MDFTMEAKKRGQLKKSARKALRRDGLIPAVIYSLGKEAISITVDESIFMKAYKQSFNEVTFFNITVDGETYRTIIRDRQMHPVTRKIVHIDFLRLEDNQTIELTIPVTYLNEPAGVKLGARLEIAVRRIKVKTASKNIPEKFEVDIKDLKIGKSILVRSLKSEDMQILSPENLALVSLNAPRGMSKTEVDALDA